MQGIIITFTTNINKSAHVYVIHLKPASVEPISFLFNQYRLYSQSFTIKDKYCPAAAPSQTPRPPSPDMIIVQKKSLYV